MAARKYATKLLVSALMAVIAALALAGTAFAAPDAQGADFHASGSALEAGEIDVATVAGAKGDTVFVSVSQKDRGDIAKFIPYTLGEGVTRGEGDNWTGIVTLDISTFDTTELDGDYTISIYASRAGGEPLYQGSLYGVYADVPGKGSVLIGTRTVGATDSADRAFVASDTLYIDHQTYRLSSPEPKAEGQILHFTYEAYDEATTVDGVMKFVDKQGNVVATTKIPGLAYNETRTVSVPAAVTADNGDVYRTVFFKESVPATNPGSISFTIPVAKMSDADMAAANYYVATIQMVDENDHVIASDSVNVTGMFRYTAPSTIYKSVAASSATGEQAVVTYTVEDDPTVVFNAATDGITTGTRVYKFHYATTPADSPEVQVAFNLVDGTKRINDEGRILETKVVTVDANNPSEEPEAQVEYNGVAYNLVGEPSEYAYTLGSGKIPVVNVYYTPEGYEPPGPYDVTVEYVNFLTGETIDSEVLTSNPDTATEINTPAEFSLDGVDYIRLDGQEEPIAHSYYSGNTSYVVYYRDKNDTMTSGTVISTIRVVYVDGGTTDEGTTDEGTTTTTTTTVVGGDEGGADAVADATANAALQLNAGRTYNVLEGEGNNGSLTNEQGVDSNTERIEEEATPLASGLDFAEDKKTEATIGLPYGAIVPIGIAAALAAIAVIVFVVVKRRKRDGEQEA